MIVVNEESFINGSTALKPEYMPTETPVEREKKKKKRGHNKNKKLRLKNKLKIMRNIAITFIVGLTLVARYSMIYDMQRELNSIKVNINETNKENENLKVELVKYNNLKYIEDNATNKLHMIQPDKGTVIYTDLDKKVVKKTEKKNDNEIQQNIWNKLKKVLF